MKRTDRAARFGRRRQQASGGFTLVEVLITSGILTALLGSLFLAFSTGGGTVRKGMETLDVVSTAGLALEYLKRDLRGLQGEVPLPSYTSPDEFTIAFMRFEGIDPSSGLARLLPVKYHFWLQPDQHRTVLTQELEGRRTAFLFDRNVAFLIGSEPSSLQAGRSVQIAFSFPATATNSSRRPPIRTAVLVLNRGLSESPQAPGQNPATPLQSLPDPAGPWTTNGTALAEKLGDLFPPESLPVRASADKRAEEAGLIRGQLGLVGKVARSRRLPRVVDEVRDLEARLKVAVASPDASESDEAMRALHGAVSITRTLLGEPSAPTAARRPRAKRRHDQRLRSVPVDPAEMPTLVRDN